MLIAGTRAWLGLLCVLGISLTSCDGRRSDGLEASANAVVGDLQLERRAPNHSRIEIYITAEDFDSITHQDRSNWVETGSTTSQGLSATALNKDVLGWKLEYLGVRGAADHYRVQSTRTSGPVSSTTTETIQYRGEAIVFWQNGDDRMGMRPPTQPFRDKTSVTKYRHKNTGETKNTPGQTE